MEILHVGVRNCINLACKTCICVHACNQKDKQPRVTSFLKKRLRCLWPIAVLLAALSVTDSGKLIGPRRASGFRSPAHLPAVYLEAGASTKWQTVPEISFNKSLACGHSSPVPLLFPQARIGYCSHVCQDKTGLQLKEIRNKELI